jgi:hypothetical protein
VLHVRDAQGGVVKVGRYDPVLQMFVSDPSPLNLNHLAFLRWLAEHGRLEHAVAGLPMEPRAEDVRAPAYSGKAS